MTKACGQQPNLPVSDFESVTVISSNVSCYHSVSVTLPFISKGDETEKITSLAKIYNTSLGRAEHAVQVA